MSDENSTPNRCVLLPLANLPRDISSAPDIWLPHSPERPQNEGSEHPGDDVADIIQEHFLDFKVDTSHETKHISKWSPKEASKDVAIVRHAFPLIASHRETVAAAASGFRLLCSYDDLAESLDATAAVSMMEEVTVVLAKDVSNVEDRNRRDSGTYGKNPTLATVWTTTILRRLRDRLREPVVERIKHDLATYCAAIAQEASLREAADLIHPSTYLSLRTRTIGLAPFFTIIASSLYPIDRAPSSDDMENDLQEAVCIAIGLQNDLIGLRREIALGQTFNLVLLLKQQGHPLECSLTAAVDCQNEAVFCAVQMAVLMAERDPSCAQYAACILAFIRTHYEWAASSRRYRAGFEE